MMSYTDSPAIRLQRQLDGIYDLHPLPTQVGDPNHHPNRATGGSAGLDVYASEDAKLEQTPRWLALGRVKTGLRVKLPPGTVGLLKDRSSLAAQGIHILGGVIDSDFRGEIEVLLVNLGNHPKTIRKGDRIAQLLVVPALHCFAVPDNTIAGEDTERGESGFGSSGK